MKIATTIDFEDDGGKTPVTITPDDLGDEQYVELEQDGDMVHIPLKHLGVVIEVLKDCVQPEEGSN